MLRHLPSRAKYAKAMELLMRAVAAALTQQDGIEKVEGKVLPVCDLTTSDDNIKSQRGDLSGKVVENVVSAATAGPTLPSVTTSSSSSSLRPLSSTSGGPALRVGCRPFLLARCALYALHAALLMRVADCAATPIARVSACAFFSEVIMPVLKLDEEKQENKKRKRESQEEKPTKENEMNKKKISKKSDLNSSSFCCASIPSNNTSSNSGPTSITSSSLSPTSLALLRVPGGRALMRLVRLMCGGVLRLHTDDTYVFMGAVATLRKALQDLRRKLDEEEIEEVEEEDGDMEDEEELGRDTEDEEEPGGYTEEGNERKDDIIQGQKTEAEKDVTQDERIKTDIKREEHTIINVKQEEPEETGESTATIPSATPGGIAGTASCVAAADCAKEYKTVVRKWVVPKRAELRRIQQDVLFEGLAVAFKYYQIPWARSAVETFFQEAYYAREEVFDDPSRCVKIVEWQAQIKKVKAGGKTFGAVLGIGEAANPVKDGRDTRISTVHGSAIWSAKQTGL